MDEERHTGSLEAAAQAPDETSTKDTNLAASRAIVQLIPGAGGFIAELISNIPRDRARRQQASQRSWAVSSTR